MIYFYIYIKYYLHTLCILHTYHIHPVIYMYIYIYIDAHIYIHLHLHVFTCFLQSQPGRPQGAGGGGAFRLWRLCHLAPAWNGGFHGKYPNYP